MKHAMELWDIKGIVAVGLNGMFAAVAWVYKINDPQFASVATDFLSKEVLPWVTLAAVLTTTILAVLNRRDKMRAMRRRELAENEIDSP
jgi:hypothetical protein